MLQNDQALWLPAKSIRALLALGLVLGITGYMLLTGHEVPDQLWTLDGVALTFYFTVSASGNGGS